MMHLIRSVIQDNPVDIDVPGWIWLLFLLETLILLPCLLPISYSLPAIYPTLAIIESDHPPAYDPIDFEEPVISSSSKPSAQARPITSSLRATKALLSSSGGLISSHLRGLACSIAASLAAAIISSPFSSSSSSSSSRSAPWSILTTALATLAASLATCQLAAAWVHIVITPSSPVRFWRRLPAFRRTLSATWQPVVLKWFAGQLAIGAPCILGRVIGVAPAENPSLASAYARLVSRDPAYLLKCAALLILAALLYVFAVLPARVVLVRVQASLLPADQDPIVPFDRSFDGSVEPLVVGGRGWVSVSQAWSTFSNAAWRRLIILNVKIFFVVMGFTLVGFFLVASQLLLLGVGASSGQDRLDFSSPGSS